MDSNSPSPLVTMIFLNLLTFHNLHIPLDGTMLYVEVETRERKNGQEKKSVIAHYALKKFSIL